MPSYRARLLADDLARILVRAQALEAGGPQLVAARPLGELHLGDQPRLDEVRVPGRAADLEGRRLALQRPHQVGPPSQRGLGEAGAALARVHEPAVLEIAEQERAGPASEASPALHPAADHQLLPQAVLDLQPGAGAPAPLVAAVPPLGDHPLQPRLPAPAAHRPTLPDPVRRRRPVGGRPPAPPPPPAP